MGGGLTVDEGGLTDDVGKDRSMMWERLTINVGEPTNDVGKD